MTTKEFFLETVKAEQPIFDRVLKAINQDKWDYRPDPVTKSAKQIATLIATEPGQLLKIVKGEVLDFGNSMPKDPELTLDQMVSMLNEAFEEIKKTVATVSDEDWDNGEAVMKGMFGEWKDKRGKMAWGFFFDLIHHRGQISTYIRAMGGKVPSIYGPSGDSAPQ
jgi:uncharacterized damage-inducible protein DinB